jgi:hypothetical protein
VEQVFKRFYPAERFARPQPLDEFSENDLASVRLPGGRPMIPKLEHYYTPEKLDTLALQFAYLMADETYSVAELQGYLLNSKWDPQGAVDNLSAWMKGQEEERAGIKEAKQRKLEAAQRRKAARELYEGSSRAFKEDTTNNQNEPNATVTGEITDPSGFPSAFDNLNMIDR